MRKRSGSALLASLLAVPLAIGPASASLSGAGPLPPRPALALVIPTFATLINAGGGGHTIQDEGSSLTQRTILNFTGANVAVTDAGGKTVVTITGASSALDNLASVAINTSLLPATAGSADLGSTTKPFGTGYFGSTQYVAVSHNGTNATFTPSTGRLVLSPFLLGNASTNIVASDAYLMWEDTGAQHIMRYATLETPDTMQYMFGTAGRNVVEGERGDESFDHAHAQRAYPMRYMHSQSQSSTKWIGFGHDDTDGRIEVGSGAIHMVSTTNFDASTAWTVSGTNVAMTSGGNETIWNGAYIAWCTGTSAPGCSSDIALNRAAAGILGLDLAASTTATRGIRGFPASGADHVGGDFLIQAGPSTGSARPGLVRLQSGPIGAASSSTAQTPIDRGVFGATLALTDASTTSLVSMTMASDTSAVVHIIYNVEALDASHVLQLDAGSITCSASNSNGSFGQNACTAVGDNRHIVPSGTLTVAWTVTAANPAIVQVNADTSLTPSTGYPRITYTVFNLTQQAIAPQ